jgi:hypothetical protein
MGLDRPFSFYRRGLLTQEQEMIASASGPVLGDLHAQ